MQQCSYEQLLLAAIHFVQNANAKQTMQILFDLDCSFIVLQWNQSKQYMNNCLQTNKIYSINGPNREFYEKMRNYILLKVPFS